MNLSKAQDFINYTKKFLLKLNIFVFMLSSSNTSQLYPPCLNKSRNNISFRKMVRMQHERRLPPVIITPKKFSKLYRLYTEGRRTNDNLLGKRKMTEHPRRITDVSFPTVPITTYTDSLESPITERLRIIKEAAQETGRLHLDYYCVTPAAIDIDIFDEKTVTYVLNFEHKAKDLKKSSGSDKAYFLKKCGGFNADAASINRLYNWLCFRILDLETSLFQVKYTDRGITNTFISAFKSEENPKELIYMIHSWQITYFLPQKEDLEAITKQGINMSVSLNEPQLDGWGRLITIFCCEHKGLTNPQKDFVKRKCLDNKNDIEPIQYDFQEEKGLWRIKSKETLLANSNDWRKCFPVKVSEKSDLFVSPPAAHFEYSPNFYLYDVFEEESDITAPNERPIVLFPYGSFYGQP
jgi:hypothetical protein